MAAHDEHTSLPGYHDEQLLHDGCDECEHRGAHVDEAIASLDSVRFVYAWHRAAELQMYGLPNGAQAEFPMLRALSMVQVQLERHGVPIGVLPGAHVGERR